VLAVTRTGEPLGVSVSPVWVLASLATAPRSPAGSEAAGVCSLPRRWKRPCRRSSPPLELYDPPMPRDNSFHWLDARRIAQTA
jgi:hypothetical protein